MASERDYTGVSTKELAELIKRHVSEGQMKDWAYRNEIGEREIRSIFMGRYQLTSLKLADKICMALGTRVDDEFTIVPTATGKAAFRMATDELEAKSEFLGLPSPTTEDIEKRAEELRALRAQVLGEPTQEQIDRLKRDSARTMERLNRQKVQSAAA